MNVLLAFDRNPGVHVRRGGERGPGPAAAVPQDCREAQGNHSDLKPDNSFFSIDFIPCFTYTVATPTKNVKKEIFAKEKFICYI